MVGQCLSQVWRSAGFLEDGPALMGVLPCCSKVGAELVESWLPTPCSACLDNYFEEGKGGSSEK